MSATSERIFSAGGLTVSNLRASLDDTKVEDILLVRLNLLKVEVVEKGLGLMDREVKRDGVEALMEENVGEEDELDIDLDI